VRALLAAGALVAALAACGGDDAGAPTTTGPTTTTEAALPAADAAVAAEAAIAEGDDLGDCPFGPTQDLVDLVPDDVPLVDGWTATDDDGQVYSGGDVDITYCALAPEHHDDGPVDEIRVDVAPLADVEVRQYLDEEFTSRDVDLDAAGPLGGGDLVVGCWEDGPVRCAAFWQAPELFVAVVPDGEEPGSPDRAEAIARAVIPTVVTRLATAA
jgi:hypothetical protein